MYLFNKFIQADFKGDFTPMFFYFKKKKRSRRKEVNAASQHGDQDPKGIAVGA